jgi:CRP-like cAMP-binding protein
VDILVSRARGESAIAESNSEVWKVDKDTFLRLLTEFEDVKMEVLDYAIKKVDNAFVPYSRNVTAKALLK